LSIQLSSGVVKGKVSEDAMQQSATHQKVTVAEVARENRINMGVAAAVVEHTEYPAE
jgi:hypothetical protein